MALVARVDAVGQMIGLEQARRPARASSASSPSAMRSSVASSIAAAQVVERRPETVRRRLGVGPQSPGSPPRSECPGCPSRTMRRNASGVLAEQPGGERDAGPAVRAVRDRDHVGVELGDLLGRHDLAARRARVPEVDDVELVLAPGDRRPRADRSRRDPALGDRVAVRDPPRLRRARARSRRRRRRSSARSVACPRAGTRSRARRACRRRARAGRVPSPRTAVCSSTCCPSRQHREGRARARAAIPEVVGARRVGDLDGLRVADELEAHADREPRGADGVARQPGESFGSARGYGISSVPAHAQPRRYGRASAAASVTDRPSGTGTWPRHRRRRQVWPVT